MTEAVRARRILPMTPECKEIVDGGILIHDGRILAVGDWKKIAGHGVQRDLGAVTIVPGLVNAHTHLELSHLAGRVATGRGFMAWADSLFAAMRQGRADESAVELAVGQAQGSGTCCLADVVAREAEMVRRVLARQGLEGLLWREFSGRDRDFAPSPLPGRWSASVHALYSTDQGLAKAVKGWCVAHDLPFSLHLAEVPGENRLFRSGGGDFADFLRARRILPKGFEAPGLSATELARNLGLLDQNTLAVHCVRVDRHDIEILAQSRAFVCLCSRSNRLIGVGDAPAADLHAAGIMLCLGTDSLASVPTLDLWEEVRAVRRLLLPATPLCDLLAMVTANPARALGLEQDYGSLEAGKRAAWAVLPDDLTEE